jgi:septal ring factor EnvC (AmiA/AmiB activator)
MALVVGFTGLFVALLALWFASEALKEVRNRNQMLQKAQTTQVSSALEKSNKVVSGLNERVKTLANQVSCLQEARAVSQETLAKLQTSKPRQNRESVAAEPSQAVARSARVDSNVA